MQVFVVVDGCVSCGQHIPSNPTPSKITQHNVMQCIKIKCNTTQHNTVQCNAKNQMQHNTTQLTQRNSTQCNAIPSKIAKRSVLRDCMRQCRARFGGPATSKPRLHHTPPHCTWDWDTAGARRTHSKESEGWQEEGRAARSPCMRKEQ